jgi:alkyl hydroperoxide reductase subunit AhpC
MTCHGVIQEKKAQILKEAPDFKATAVVDGVFETVSLSSYRGKYVVLVFYPLNFTFVCPTEIIAYNDRLKEFADLNAQVLFCSVDSEYSHLKWSEQSRKEGGLSPMACPMISDLTKSISSSYGVLLDDGYATRGTFIIDEQGIVKHITINEPPVGRSVDETLRVLKAIQFHSKHGDVCPANWNPGNATINPDPKKALPFFSKNNN